MNLVIGRTMTLPAAKARRVGEEVKSFFSMDVTEIIRVRRYHEETRLSWYLSSFPARRNSYLLIGYDTRALALSRVLLYLSQR